MSASIRIRKFLLDENVHQQLRAFLQSHGLDVKIAPKAVSDKQLAGLSKKEKRILVTNDEDFTTYTSREVFAIIWLRIPQSNTVILISSFEKLIKSNKSLSGKLVILGKVKYEIFSLGKKIKPEDMKKTKK